MFTPTRPAPKPSTNINTPSQPFQTPPKNNESHSYAYTSMSPPASFPTTPENRRDPYSHYAASTASTYSTPSHTYSKYQNYSPSLAVADRSTDFSPPMNYSYHSPSHQGYHTTAPTYDYSRSSNSWNSPSPSYSSIPSDLAILDSRGRQNLLGDLEFIAGKKFNFPFLNKWTNKASAEEKRNDQDSYGKKGRGVREGNFI